MPKQLEVSIDYLIGRAGITKAELARRLGMSQFSTNAWRVTVPSYVVAYLELLIEYQKLLPIENQQTKIPK